ncbi:MAG: replication initiation factor domain-containing protein [Erysipelotrichales bacterium]|nr:replication initiation factor domain-containing protein [Erysipelotrichales bacterium]
MNKKTVIFDYLSFTISLKVEEWETIGRTEFIKQINWEHEAYFLCKEYAGLLGFATDEIFKQERPARNFKYRWSIGEFVEFHGIGPENKHGFKTCRLELKGQACREVEEIGVIDIYELITTSFEKGDINFTKIDIAIDDFEGKHSDIEKIRKKLDKKDYTSCFRNPYKIMGNEAEGFTLYLGTRESTSMLRIYDKLKEQLKKGNLVNSHFWTRYEMSFMKEKANALAGLLYQANYKDLKKISLPLLAEMLDIKEENNFDEEHKYMISTVDWWKSFLEDSEKLKLSDYVNKRQSTQETKNTWLSGNINKIWLTREIYYIGYAKEYLEERFKETIEAFDKITNKDLYVINKARKKRGWKELKSDDVITFIKQVREQSQPEQKDFLHDYDVSSLQVLKLIEKEKYENEK